MRTLCLALLLLAGSALGAQQDDTKPTNAVKRVISLLSEMKSQLEAEAESDQELYDKLVCWCETNNKEKTLAVATEEQAIIDLGHAINENAAKEATLTSEVSALKAGIAENKETLAESDEMRAKEEDAFYESEKQATMSLAATKNAIKMLEKHNSLSQTSLIELKKHADRDAKTAELFKKVAKGMVKHQVFLQQSSSQAPSGGSYAPQSGAIFGILQQMAETFQLNSAQAKKDEADAATEFANLKKAKTAEVAASTEKATTKTLEAATAKEVAANSKVALADNREALAADTEFLANLKVTCDGLDRQWAQRSKTRADETAAVAETISILTDDDSAELMGNSLSFVQVPGDMEARAREVSRLLKSSRNPKAARKQTGLVQARKQGMSTAARTEAELNPAFAKVKDSVGKMKDDLNDQKAVEVRTNDECIVDLRKLNKDITASTNEKEDAETAVADLTQAIAGLEDDVKALKKQISETQVEMKRASEDRELENKEFQSVVADQRATQAVLKKAVDRLAKFYESKAALIQKSVTKHHAAPSAAMRLVDGFLQESKQAPPGGGFQPYAKKGGAGGVMGMIEDLVTDSKELEAEAVSAEKDAQANYEKMIGDSNASVDADTKEIANKQAEKGAKDGEKTEAQASADASLKDLMSLGELGQLLHKKCDFLMQNFGARQDALGSEMKALDQSMAMLSGA